ncbi:hypothetical protein BLOT_012088 [Blomia tropicalis]|nr:hypothetical protein BLOT_012088 [Blomia tropicalis]
MAKKKNVWIIIAPVKSELKTIKRRLIQFAFARIPNTMHYYVSNLYQAVSFESVYITTSNV